MWMPIATRSHVIQHERPVLTSSTPLQVRMVVERLARRVGFEVVAAAMPEQHAKLLTHIRKEKNRQRRQRAQQDGDEVRLVQLVMIDMFSSLSDLCAILLCVDMCSRGACVCGVCCVTVLFSCVMSIPL